MSERKSNQPRTRARISLKLEKNLAAYMAAAGAATVGLVAIAAPAEGKVVYTPVNVNLAENSQYFLDVNHDGVNDFFLTHFSYGHFDHFYAIGSPADRLLGNAFGSASALRAGVPIGPQGHFSAFGLIAKVGGASGSSYSFGNWKNAHNRYLGLQFSIDGKTHYGWARLSVTINRGITATLTGYAYETIPNKRIVAGETSDPEVAESGLAPEMLVPSRQPANLAMLASGVFGFSVWRRDSEFITDDRSKAQP